MCEYWPRGNIVGEFDEQVHCQVNGTSWINTTQRMRYVVLLFICACALADSWNKVAEVSWAF